MSFNVVTFAVSKRYTDTEVAGGGAIQGKNCVISSIADIPATESKPAGQRVTFQWTLDNGTVETGTMDVYNGKDGESIDRMYVNEEGHLIVVYDNGESEDCGEITIPSSQSDWAEDDPEENSYIQHKELVYSAINDAVSAERSARQIVEAQLSAAISAISDDVSSQGTAIGTINRQLSSLIDDVGTNTSAISSINTQLSAIIDDVGTNTSAISTINRQLSAIIDDVGTNTSAISAINQDLASRADIKSIGTGLNLDSTTGELTATGGGGGTTDYPDLTNKPSINNVTLTGNKTSADLGFGTASALNVASSGDASSTEVVKGDDTRLTDSRNAADVYSWAKEATKPSYTASEVGAIASTEKGANSGVAELDTNGKVPSAQLPSYVDDVVEYASTSAFPATGESGKIYIALDTNKTYRWGGSEYVEISESLALGETASTAYAGNKGKANADAINAIKDGQTIDSFGDVETALSGKADKVSGATNGNFAGLDSNGNLTDSGSKASDFLTSHQDISGKADLTVLAAEYDDSVSYVVGDYVTFSGKVYRCVTNHAAGTPWRDFVEVKVAGQYVTIGKLANTSLGEWATAEGLHNTASGDYAHAEGHQNIASGTQSHAEGYTNTASAFAAHAEGSFATASGDDSHAEGYLTTASGTSSHASGRWTTAQRKSQTVIGEANIADTTGNSTTDRGAYAFIIGNGTGENVELHSNALTVDWSGSLEAAGDISDGHGNVLNEMFWKGTTTQWTNLSASEKAKYDGKVVIFTDDAGDYTGMPQPYSFTITGSGSSVTTTFNHASITADMRVIEAIAETPSAVLSDISITTANGSMTVTATVNGSSVVKVLMQPCKAEIALT